MREVQESGPDVPLAMQWSKKKEGGLLDEEEGMEDGWHPAAKEYSFPYRYLNRTKRELLLSSNGASNGGFTIGVSGGGVKAARAGGGNGQKEINGKKLHSVRTCTLYLQADQKLYDAIYAKEGQRNHIRTREEIVSARVCVAV